MSAQTVKLLNSSIGGFAVLAFGSSCAGSDTVACGFASLGSVSIAGLGVCRVLEARRAAMPMMVPYFTLGSGVVYSGICFGLTAYMLGYDVPGSAAIENINSWEDLIPRRKQTEQDILMAAGSRD